jgi:hypothetical protein
LNSGQKPIGVAIVSRFPLLTDPLKTAVIRSVLSGLEAKMGPTLFFTESLAVGTLGRETRLVCYPAFCWAKFAWISTPQK